MPRAIPGFVSSKFSTSITTWEGKESHSNINKGYIEESALGREGDSATSSPESFLPLSVPSAEFFAPAACRKAEKCIPV